MLVYIIPPQKSKTCSNEQKVFLKICFFNLVSDKRKEKVVFTIKVLGDLHIRKTHTDHLRHVSIDSTSNVKV